MVDFTGSKKSQSGSAKVVLLLAAALIVMVVLYALVAGQPGATVQDPASASAPDVPATDSIPDATAPAASN